MLSAVIIETLLVISVAAFHLAVMPGRFGTNRLMDNVKSAANNIQRMDTICLTIQFHGIDLCSQFVR